MLGHGGVAPVPGTAHVGGDALSLMEDLDGAVRSYCQKLVTRVSGGAFG